MKRHAPRMIERTWILFLVVLPFVFEGCCRRGEETGPECPIRIGIVNSETGSQAVVGRESVMGYEIAQDEINDAGGVLGCRLELVFEDDESDSSQSMVAVKTLAEEGVPVIIGAAFSGGTIPATGVANVYQVPFLVPIASSDLVTDQGYEWTFRINAPSAAYASTALDLVRETLGAEARLGIVYEDSQFGESAAVAAAVSAREREIEVVAYESYAPGEPDYSPTLEMVRSSGADVIYFASRPVEAVLLMEQCQALGLNPRLYIGHAGGFVTNQFLEAGRVAEYVVVTAQWAPDVNWPGAAEFTGQFIDLYGTVPTMRSAQTYQALYVAAEAIEQADEAESLDWADGPAVRDAIREALRTMVLEETIFGPIRFDETGQNPHQVLLLQVIGGEFVTVYPEAYRAVPPVVPVPPWDQR